MPKPTETPDPRLIVALDFPDRDSALRLVEHLPIGLCRLKVGKELFTRAGPDLVRELGDRGFEVFLDLKFHDIPHTVARACIAAADLGVWMVNVHALGGRRMIQAAREGLEQSPGRRPLLTAVTVLTSLDQADLAELGLIGSPEENVLRLARLAQTSGADGVVCSAQEVPALRGALGPDFVLVTPGIRPAGAGQQDQKRVMTPAQAIAAGSDYLVVGRPVTQASDPAQVLHALAAEVRGLTSNPG